MVVELIMAYNYYSNPAFCQQSEFASRRSPVGAQNVPQLLSEGNVSEEQEFYEEVVVDDRGFITDKKIVVIAQNNEGKKYIQNHRSADEKCGARYGSTLEDKCSVRYSPPINDKSSVGYDAQIEDKSGARYGALIKCSEDKSVVRLASPVDDKFGVRYGVRYAFPESKPRIVTDSHRYEYIPMKEQDSWVATSPQKKMIHRYAVVDVDGENELTSPSPGSYAPRSPPRYHQVRSTPPKIVRSPSERVSRPVNPVATQRLYELLSTPKKSPARSIQPARVLSLPPKAQQKLSYAPGQPNYMPPVRHTAVVAPICSTPERCTSLADESGSWTKARSRATISVAATMMFLCGSVTAGLCFYMIGEMGRLYFLDFGLVSGFACVVLGLLGYRSRNVYWLPNRNYMSGYLVMSVFSLLTCSSLLVLLVKQPRPGSPLADITSGTICGFSALTLLLSSVGVISSYCCSYPPPDNRVQHGAEGFSV